MSPDLLYILSPSYSGSTLLTFVLANHPEIATVGELKASSMGDIERYRCSCGALLSECGFWKGIQEEMRRRDARFSLADFGTHLSEGGPVFCRLVTLGVKHPRFDRAGSLVLSGWPRFRARLHSLLEQNRALIDLITSAQRARIFLDASKDPERLLHFQRSGFWNIRAVHLIRDGRGVANSYMKHYGVNMSAAAREWRRSDLACKQAKSVVPASNVLTLKYEDLCRFPEESRKRVMEFAGLNGSRNGDRAPADFHILGNDMRLSGVRSIQFDEKWKKELRAQELQTFAESAGPLNAENGYQ